MSALPIERISVTTARVPSRLASTEIASPMDLFATHRQRRGSWYGSMENVIVEVSAEGHTGFAVTQGGRAVSALISSHLGPLLLGKDAAEIEELWELCRRAALPYGADGLASMARSVIDLALWDLRGLTQQAPIHELLGSAVRPLPTYASGNDIDDHRAQGFDSTKWGIDIGPWSDNAHQSAVDQLRAARERAGSGHTLMVDAWMGWNRDFTVSLAPVLEELGIEWLEEPLPPDAPGSDLDAIRRALGPTRLAAGEHAYSLQAFARLVDAGVDVLQPDLAWCGGLTEGLRIAELAATSGVELAPHLGGAAWGLALATASPSATRAEWYVGSAPGEPLETEPSILSNRSVPLAGLIAASDNFGFGVSIDADALASYRIDSTIHIEKDT